MGRNGSRLLYWKPAYLQTGPYFPEFFSEDRTLSLHAPFLNLGQRLKQWPPESGHVSRVDPALL